MKFDLNIQNINYVKINYKDDDGFAHCIKGAIRLFSEYEILACVKYDENLHITTPQDVDLNIATDNGLYKAHTTLKKIEDENPYLLFSMRKPEDMEYQQKREYFRVKLQEDANIIFVENEQEIQITALTYDISANGIRIELDKKVDFPQDVQIKLFLPKKTVELSAKYIRTDEDDQILKASFHFYNISESDLDYISQICLQKQLEERRKNLL